MIDIDDLLASAGDRALEASARLPLPAAPKPSRPVGPMLLAAATVVAVGAGGYSALRPSARGTQVGAVPQAFLDGVHGPEITMSEIDDGDGDPKTVTLRAAGFWTGASVERFPIDVKLYPADREPSATTAPGTGGPTPEAQPFPEGSICVEINGAGGVCPLEPSAGQLVLGSRAANGSGFVAGLPTETVAVAFTSGSEKYWARPVRGIAAFPFTEAAEPIATTVAYAADGSTIMTSSADNPWLTKTEVSERAITRTTSEVLEAGWFYDVPVARMLGETIRHKGRIGGTGFPGPIAIQGVCDPCEGGPGTWVVTVQSSDRSVVEQRLASLGGSIRSAQPEPGVTVLVWADASSSAGLLDKMLAGLTRRDVDPAAGRSLDDPLAFDSDNAPLFHAQRGVMSALFADEVGTIDDLDVLAVADDIGAVMFSGYRGSQLSGVVTVSNDPAFEGPKLPVVGVRAYSGLTAVPANVASLTITLSDGTKVTPELLDVRPFAPARLYHSSVDDAAELTVVNVETTTE